MAKKSIQSAVQIAAEFRQELARLDGAAVEVMLEAWQGVEAGLLEEMERFAERFPPGTALTPGQVVRMERYRDLYAQLQAELGPLERVAAGAIEAGTRQAVGLGTAQAVGQLESLGVGVGFNRLPAAAVENVVGLARAGRPLAALMEPMYGQAAQGIIRELVSGVALGLGPRQIARRMAGDGLTDGLNHLLLLTRDQVNRAHRGAALETYKRSEMVRGYVRRCARQVGRTCIACVALDGKFYELDDEFEEHPQGRCTMIPVVEGVELRPLGSGQAWFAGLSAEEQRATMGAGRWEAWRDGRLTWDGMVRRREHPVWGTSVTPRSIGVSLKAKGTRKPNKGVVEEEFFLEDEESIAAWVKPPGVVAIEKALQAKFPSVGWDFTFLDEDTAKRVGGELERLLDHYPQTLRTLTRVQSYGADIGALAMVDGQAKTIKLSAHYFKNVAALDRELAQAKAKNWLDAGNDLESIIAHEFGHVVHFGYRSRWQANPHVVGGVIERESRDLFELMRRWEREVEADESLSRYATVNEKEAFAEGFAQMARVPESEWSEYTRHLSRFLDELPGIEAASTPQSRAADYFDVAREERDRASEVWRDALRRVGL